MKRLSTIIILILLASFVSHGAAQSANYYVSPTGNDSNPGTLEAPWLTIQHAINVVPIGAIITVQDGEYEENLNVWKSVTLAAQPGAEIIGVKSSSPTPCIKISASNVTIQDFIIRDCYGYGVFTSADKTNIIGNTITNAVGSGIYMDGDYLVADGNEISVIRNYLYPESSYRTDADGIRFFGSHHVIVNNYIHDINHKDLMHYTNCSDSQAQIDENCWAHIDGFQTWRSAVDILFENNTVILPYNTLPDGTLLKNLMIKYTMIERNSSSYTVSNIIFRNNTFISYAITSWHPAQIGHNACSSSYPITDVLFDGNTFTGNGTMAVLLQCINGITFQGNTYSGYSRHYWILKSVINLVDNDGSTTPPTNTPAPLPTYTPTRTPQPTPTRTQAPTPTSIPPTYTPTATPTETPDFPETLQCVVIDRDAEYIYLKCK